MDKLIIEFDKAWRTLFAPAQSRRPHPDASIKETLLNRDQTEQVIGLMRVNHCGEVCAQALYQGQALTARDPHLTEALRGAAHEEIEHLAWTQQRLTQLGGRKSLLNPLWYVGSLFLGCAAGICGDRYNLGFLAETERQVGQHLQKHLRMLPTNDDKSRAIVTQMYHDETAHAHLAKHLGAAALPPLLRFSMRCASTLMTTLSYHV